LERLTKRLDQLCERSEYLEEFATLTQRERDRRYQPDLAQSYSDLLSNADYLEIELLCAHLKESSQALVRLTALGSGANRKREGAEDWLLELARMYLLWAKKKGYEFEVFVHAQPGWSAVKMEDVASLMRRLEEIGSSQLAISMKGANIYGFTKGEAGTHKRLTRADESEATTPFQTTVVQVDPLEENASPGDLLERLVEEDKKATVDTKESRPRKVPEIIRVYTAEGNRSVRDLRTGVKTTQVDDVLDGDLDAFILAYLRTKESESAWD
jgi:peptide chain release factor 2